MDAIIGAMKSKTMWAAVATAVLGSLYDPVNAWVGAHAGWAAVLVSTMFAALRASTTQSLASKGSPAGQAPSA